MSGQHREIRLYAQGWAFSFLLHALAVGSAVVFLRDLKLIPEPEPFKWDVALVETPQPKPVEQPARPPSSEPAPAKPAPSKPTPVESMPVEPLTVVRTVQTVQTVQQVVRQTVARAVQQRVQENVTEVRPVVKASAQPAATVSRTVQSVAMARQEQAAVAVAPIGMAAQVDRATETVVGEPTIVQTNSVARVEVGEPKTVRETQVAAVVRQQTVAESGPSVVERSLVTRPAPVGERTVPEEAAKAAPVIQDMTLREPSVRSGPPVKADYGWLAEALWHRVALLKRYPHAARVGHLEGRVVLRVVIKEDGHLMDLAVAESSGHSALDQDALELVRRACPLKLKHPLGRSHVVVQLPINYRLEH